VDECNPLHPGVLVNSTAVGGSLQCLRRTVLQAGVPDGGGGDHSAAAMLGRAVQVDPIKPKMKAPGSMLLKLRCDEPPSNFAFKFNFRRYSWARCRTSWARPACSPPRSTPGRAPR
jgi:hypothetical protein